MRTLRTIIREKPEALLLVDSNQRTPLLVAAMANKTRSRHAEVVSLLERCTHAQQTMDSTDLFLLCGLPKRDWSATLLSLKRIANEVDASEDSGAAVFSGLASPVSQKQLSPALAYRCYHVNRDVWYKIFQYCDGGLYRRLN